MRAAKCRRGALAQALWSARALQPLPDSQPDVTPQNTCACDALPRRAVVLSPAAKEGRPPLRGCC
ncbi:hypothetical protein BD311DRAFT_773521 [Dichomitus squalens]|uniref:Uncharacterized protein n=1 Tax=Dichomitus squalens TaxID=114155 RepID=A0A4Q9N1Q1_9APHY|nr:hypothetical protein BD311DRAFT_773521 [Dichomitus squalens]TBU62136.1 hypothetical protein BD310DRAFT_946179 [Dichomitus squalens]